MPGLSSRIGHHIDFPDYDTDELMDICRLMLKEQHYKMSEDTEKAFRQYTSWFGLASPYRIEYVYWTGRRPLSRMLPFNNSYEGTGL